MGVHCGWGDLEPPRVEDKKHGTVRNLPWQKELGELGS